MGKDGKKKLAVTKEQLNRKSGETLTQAYNRYEGKTPSKSSGASSSAKATDGDSGKKSFRQRRAARLEKRIASGSGSDSRKAIQSKRLERVKKRIEDSKKEPSKMKKMMAGGEARGPRDRGTTTVVRRNMGGMMKSKMASKGGKMGGKMAKKGYAKGGAAFPDLTGDGKVTQKDILKGRGVSGMKKGGMAKKGYSKGGAAMKSKGGTKRGKPKGVGAALRGYGKAMR
jgi:hypothetical protein